MRVCVVVNGYLADYIDRRPMLNGLWASKEPRLGREAEDDNHHKCTTCIVAPVTTLAVCLERSIFM